MKPEVSHSQLTLIVLAGILEQTRRSTMEDILKIKTNAEVIENNRRASEEKQKT